MSYPEQNLPDPTEISFNGELATLDELTRLEDLARSFLDEATPLVFRMYGYGNESAGIMFQTVVDETEPPCFQSTIAVNRGDLDCPFFILTVDEGNEVVDFRLDEEVGPSGLALTLESLLLTEQFTEAEAAIIKHFLTFTQKTIIMSAVDEDMIDTFNADKSNEDEQRHKLADYIRDLVEARTVGFRMREFIAEDGQELQVVANNFVGQIDDEDFFDMTAFQVDIIDPETGIAYHYTVDFNGVRELVLEEPEKPNADGYIELGNVDDDEEVEELANALGFYDPGKNDTQKFTKLLSDAWAKANGLNQR